MVLTRGMQRWRGQDGSGDYQQSEPITWIINVLKEDPH